MQQVLEFLLRTAFTAGNQPVSWLEIVGFVSGAICVLLVVRQHVLNWPIGLIQVIAYIFVFIDAKLYADAGLQFIYVALGIWGWINWNRVKENQKIKPKTSNKKELLIQLASLALLTLVLWTWLRHKTDSSTPLPDAATTALSLVATYGQAKKLIESWYFWILADLIYVPLYFYKHLSLTAILYAGFLALCVAGFRSWNNELELELAVSNKI